MRSKWFHVDRWKSRGPKYRNVATAYPVEWINTRWITVAYGLDIIRDDVGEPIDLTPNGGYRNEAHNKLSGGKRLSEHRNGRAADIKVVGRNSSKWPAKKLHDHILQMYKDGKLPTLTGLGLYDTFVHVDFGGSLNAKGQIRRWNNRTQEP